MTTVEVLQKARALVEEPGVWAQGSHEALQCGRACAVLAITQSWCGGAATRDAMTTLAKAAGGDGREPGPFIIDWNDAPGRTQAEVLAAFDRAISLASGEPAAGPTAPTEEK